MGGYRRGLSANTGRKRTKVQGPLRDSCIIVSSRLRPREVLASPTLSRWYPESQRVHKEHLDLSQWFSLAARKAALDWRDEWRELLPSKVEFPNLAVRQTVKCLGHISDIMGIWYVGPAACKAYKSFTKCKTQGLTHMCLEWHYWYVLLGEDIGRAKRLKGSSTKFASLRMQPLRSRS